MRFKNAALILVSLWVLLSVTAVTAVPAARADEAYTFVVKKQDDKAKSRWSLSEWLDTRDRMRMMDLWLALHSPSPYEFFVGADQRLPGGGSRGWRAHGGAYASIFGLDFERRFDPGAETVAAFDLRVFGFHQQSTNITWQAGLRSRDYPVGGVNSDVRSAFTGVALTLYVAKNFGVDGLWRHHFAPAPNRAGLTDSGSRWNAGPFIDFRMLRLYGGWYAETVETQEKGIDLGARFYF